MKRIKHTNFYKFLGNEELSTLSVLGEGLKCYVYWAMEYVFFIKKKFRYIIQDILLFGYIGFLDPITLNPIRSEYLIFQKSQSESDPNTVEIQSELLIGIGLD